VLTGIGGTGIVATFDSGVPGPTLLFRSELDALPIVEVADMGHASTVDGVSHKCGHDGHTTMVCGLALSLAARRPARGRVHLLFKFGIKSELTFQHASERTSHRRGASGGQYHDRVRSRRRVPATSESSATVTSTPASSRRRSEQGRRRRGHRPAHRA
jgi:hypothetical protein